MTVAIDRSAMVFAGPNLRQAAFIGFHPLAVRLKRLPSRPGTAFP